MTHGTDAGMTLPRRTFLASALGAAVMPRVRWPRVQGDPDEAEIARVRAKAKDAGLGAFGVSRNDQYLAIGDAPEKFRKLSLEYLLGLARDYFKHFKEKGFDVKPGASRMTLVILSDRRSCCAYLNEPLDEDVRGTYDLKTNDLIFFDNRADGPNPFAAKDNTLVLFHEATHQLAFNTGLMRREGDIPRAIAEGMAEYAEVRGLGGKPGIGARNEPRLRSFRPPQPREALNLPSIGSMITNDGRLLDPETRQLGYSEAWLLVHYLMKTDELLPKFRAYLKAIRDRDDAGHRPEDWEAHFGDPKAMDRGLASYLKKLLKMK